MGAFGRAAQRGAAVLTAAATFWMVQVTAGSATVSAAARSAAEALVPAALQWELCDLWRREPLSPAAMLAISQSPLLLSARYEVAALWAQDEEPEDSETLPARTPEPAVRPVTETPLTVPAPAQDNGVPARTLVPTDPTAYARVGSAVISSSTEYDLSGLTPAEPPAAPGDGPLVLILHTHGSECYTPAGEEVAYTGDHRTTDTRYNVVRVGDAMAETLEAAGIAVIHDRSLYDYPAYAGAYERSLAAVEGYLKQYPSIRYVLDVHRDAVEDTEGRQYKVVSVTEEGTAAQLTLVVGSDGSGLPHPLWRENLRLAAALQQRLTARHDTLMRPILLRNSRYNQHTLPGALLLEAGAAGNSPEEAVLAGQLFARILAEFAAGR